MASARVATVTTLIPGGIFAISPLFPAGAKDLYAVGHFYNDTTEDKTVEVKFHADCVKFK
jgi:hypothetical protein